jgi:hypothetical protein
MFVFYIHTVPYMFGSINASCTANRMCTQTFMYDGILMEVWRVALLLYVYTCRSLNSNPRCNMLINPPTG